MVIAPTADRGHELRHTYRIGFSTGRYTSLGTFFHREQNGFYDELVSTGTGEIYRIDTVQTSNYSFRYTSQMATMDLGIQWNTRQERRFSFYAGALASLGVSTGTSRAQHSVYLSYESSQNSSQPIQIDQPRGRDYYAYESTRNQPSFVATIGLPMGMQFRLGKTTPILSHFRFTGEFRPGVISENVKGYGTVATTIVNYSMGLQYQF